MTETCPPDCWLCQLNAAAALAWEDEELDGSFLQILVERYQGHRT